MARVIWPEYVWKQNNDITYCHMLCMTFTHTTDDALGKMAIWLAKNSSGGRDWLQVLLQSDNPHRAIALAIIEAGGNDE